MGCRTNGLSNQWAVGILGRNRHKKHHTTLCSQNQSQPTLLVRSTSQTPTPPTPATGTDTVHFTSTDRNHGTVLLKTAKADIINGAITSHEMILFDEGATKSFIKQDVVDKLNLRSVRKETINLAVFGNKSPSSQDFNIVKLNIKTQAGNYIQITAVVVPQISTPIRNMPVRDINKFQHLRNIKLAHPPTDDKTSDITVLIGADYYWDIVENHTIRGNGPTAVASKLGYLLSGPCYNNDIHQDTSKFFINAQPKHEYLTALREHHLSNQKPNIQQTIKVGDIVIFHTDNKKRLEWPLAKVLKLSQGNDGYIHSAQIKMQNGVTQRPIVKLYPLEINAATELCGEITNTTPQASTRDTQSAVVPNSPPPLTETLTPQPSTPDTHDERRPRASAIKAKQTIKTWTKQFNKTN